MLISKMSTNEIIKEIRDDKCEIDLKMNAYLTTGKYAKSIRKRFKQNHPLKRKDLYYQRNLSIDTSNHNRWNINICSYYKNYEWSGYTRYETKKGYSLATIRKEEVFLFTPHFFSRYKERFLNMHYTTTNLTPIENWFLRNNLFLNIPVFFHELTTSESHLLFSDGVGVAITNDYNLSYEIRTFLSFETLKKTQLEHLLNYAHQTTVSLLDHKDKSRRFAIQKKKLTILLSTALNNIISNLKKYDHPVTRDLPVLKNGM